MLANVWDRGPRFSDRNTGSGITQTVLFDPVSHAVESFEVTETSHDMFCPGISMLETGQILVSGGQDSHRSSLYSYGTWEPAGDLNIARGYGSSVTLSDGRVRASCSLLFSRDPVSEAHALFSTQTLPYHSISRQTELMQVFLLGGSWSGFADVSKDAEIFDLDRREWRELPGISATEILTNDPQGSFRADNYGWFFAWTGGSGALLAPAPLCVWHCTP